MTAISKGLVTLLIVYRRLISPLLGPRCRFFPSCSEYAIECLKQYRLTKALRKIVTRVVSCNPFHSGGVDLP